ATIHPLAISGHRGQHNEFSHPPPFRHALQKGRGASDVDVYVVLYFIERLGHADDRGRMHHSVNAFKGFGAVLSIADVSYEQLGPGCQIRGVPMRVDLWVEIVEEAHLVTCC